MGRGEAEVLPRTGPGSGAAPPRGGPTGPRPAGLWPAAEQHTLVSGYFSVSSVCALGCFYWGVLFGFLWTFWFYFGFDFYLYFYFYFYFFHCKLYTEMSQVFFLCVCVFGFVLVFFLLLICQSHFPSIFWNLGFKRTLAPETVVSIRRARTGR